MTGFGSRGLASLAAALGCSAALLPAQHQVYSFPSELRGSFYGEAVATPGDLDGDGLAELLIGAPRTGVDNVLKGVVELRSGATGALLRRHVGERGFDFFGSTVAGVGDVDGDGVGDYVVGARFAPNTSPTRSGPGKAYLYSGKSGKLLRTHAHATTDQGRGVGAVGLGDVDGDRRADYAISFATDRTGAVALYSGADGKELWKVTRTFPAFPRGLGYPLAGLGDLDGDGVADLAMGTGRTGAGMVLVVSGKTGRQIHLLRGNNGLGEAIAGLPDISGDGVPDFVAGMPAFRQGNVVPGAVRFFSGKDTRILRTLVGDAGGSGFGRAIVSLGDYDRDGKPEIAVHAGCETLGSSCRGAILVFQPDAFAAERVLTARPRDQRFGIAMARLDDVNGDRRPDLLVGAPDNMAGGRDRAGAAYVLSLRPLTLTTPTRTVSLLPAGFQVLELHGGKAHAGERFLVLGSASGRTPPLRFGGLTIPLRLDPYLTATVADPQAVVFGNLRTLDAAGEARAAFRLPPGLPPALAGAVLHHGYVLFGAGGLTLASNSVPVTITMF